MRPIVTAAIVVALAATGCTNYGFDKANRVPQNDGANADVAGVSLRNAFLLRGNADPPAAGTPEALFAVLVNDSARPVQLERITVDGGGSVQLAGPVTLPPNQPVGTGNQPIGTVSGVRANTVPMTFIFKDADAIRVSVPVKTRTDHFANLPSAPAGPVTPAPAPPSPTRPISPPPSPSPTG
ncbi:hypothetical protein [Nonomuraea sp. KM90]|uniref:hypothetical protein n=1 Tax=Nonomuraea sp. KM90 TaxID=3457428 RepID=UPI003FCE41C5